MSSSNTTGSCLCHKVRYEVTGPPKTTLLCHCDNCRKSTGSLFMANSFYQKSQLRVLAGEHLLTTYEDNKNDSGNTLARSFCSICGSPLFVSSKDNPLGRDAVTVTSGTMDLGPAGTGNDNDEWMPQREVFCKKRKEWLPELSFTKKSVILE